MWLTIPPLFIIGYVQVFVRRILGQHYSKHPLLNMEDVIVFLEKTCSNPCWLFKEYHMIMMFGFLCKDLFYGFLLFHARRGN